MQASPPTHSSGRGSKTPRINQRASRRTRGGPRQEPKPKPAAAKARTRQELIGHIANAHQSLLLFNRPAPPGLRRQYLERATQELEAAVRMRPGSHILQRQLVLCQLAAESLATCGEEEPMEIVLHLESLRTSPPRRL